jgi:crossover junction endodeoxyribonuclease RuvC
VGHADKDQVMAMVKRLLPTAGVHQFDAADALAAAIAHAHLAGTRAKIAGALAGEVVSGSPSARATNKRSALV